MTLDSSSNPYYWTRDHLDHVICYSKSAIFKNKEYIKAFTKVDRKDFVPDKHKDISYMDQDIQIGFGQKLLKPTTTAYMLKLLEPKENGRYLVIGAGSGYLAAILGFISGEGGCVIALERVLLLVEQIRKNLKNYPELNSLIEPVFKDGIEGYADMGPFDGIVSTVYYEEIPDIIIKQIKFESNIVCPYPNNEIRVITRKDRQNISEKIYRGFVFDKIQTGVE